MVPVVDLERRVIDLLDAGVRLLQLRLKTTPLAERIFVGRRVRALTRASDALLIVNDSPDMAREIDADGVHLGATDAAVEAAREVLGPDKIVGVTCYADEERVSRFGPEEVSYIGLSSPWKSPTKPDKPSPEMEEFIRLVRLARVPVYAIGGMTPDRANLAVQAGCHGAAAITALFATEQAAVDVPRFFKAMGARP